MRKFIVVLGVALLFLVACDEDTVQMNDDELDKEQPQIENENIDEESEGVSEDSDQNSSENESANDNASINEENEKEDEPQLEEQEDVKDVAENIIWAQVDQDYDYLASVAADGVTVNKEDNTIDFDTSESTHTFDFLTGIEKEDLEFRFVDGEDTDRAIVGFAAIDYEKEYSYVVEMILIDVNGSWKLLNMDINK